MLPRRRPRQPRGSVVVIVIWAIAIAAIVVAATQVVAFRQATMGREALSRVQARWAARAGVEESIAVLEYHALRPDAEDVLVVYRDLEACADGDLATGSWSIRHSEDGVEKPGPQDEGAKINLNRITRPQLINLENMTFDVADAIIDWRDADNDVQGMGAERNYYLNRDRPTPRNGNFRSFLELELVAGAWPQYVRGEDMNLNGRLDPNENDGSVSPPDDDADGLLDAGWSQYLTAYTTLNMMGASGEEKLYLKDASADDVKARFGLDDNQARALLQYAKGANATLEALLITDLGTLSQGGGTGGRNGSNGGRSTGRSSGNSGRGGNNQNANNANTVKALDTNQLRLVFQEGTLDDPTKLQPGKVNINTASQEVLKRVLGLDSFTVDGILNMRASKSGGITSVVDLMESNKITPQVLAGLATQIDTTSQVFTITSRGRSEATGLEVEITVVVDRSTVPARILEYREQ